MVEFARFAKQGRAGSVGIKRAGCACARAFHDMEINHGGFDAGMSQKRLDGADVGAGLEKMRRKRMAHGVTGGTLGNGRLSDGVFELTL